MPADDPLDNRSLRIYVRRHSEQGFAVVVLKYKVSKSEFNEL